MQQTSHALITACGKREAKLHEAGGGEHMDIPCNFSSCYLPSTEQSYRLGLPPRFLHP